MLDLLFFICALIYLASSLIVAWKVKSPEHRYKGENLFFFGQIISKLNTTSKTMTLICITLVLAILMFIAAPILTGWASGYLDMRSMYDVQVYSRYNDVYEEENLPQDSYEIITEFLTEHKIDTVYDCTFNLYLSEKDDFHNRQKYDFPIVAISLSMGFSLLRALEFFVFRKMEMPETKTHLLCGWSQIVIQKNHLSVTIELFRHYCKKGKVILWQKRITI